MAAPFSDVDVYLRCMLQKENRLRRDKDLKRVFEKGKSVFDEVCGVKVSKNGLDVSRFAVIAGTKVSKSAIKRNRVRRQYREILRLNLNQLKPGYDVVLLTSAKALDLEFHEKEDRLMGVLKKAKLLV